MTSKKVSLIPTENYTKYFDSLNSSHKAWLQATLDHLVSLDPYALSTGKLRDIWTGPLKPALSEEIELALSLIREQEGCSLEAYPDAITGGEPWTIGWGSTTYEDGSKVKPGDRITQDKADEMLLDFTKKNLATQERRIETWSKMNVPQKAALLSFGYNLGVNWYGGSRFTTITANIKKEQWSAVPKTLEKYIDPGSPAEAGLLERRKAEGRVFAQGTAQLPPVPVAPPNPPPKPPTSSKTPVKPVPRPPAVVYPNPLKVFPYKQLDSATDQGRRMCFSSANAMLLEHMKPGTLKGANGDDQYLKVVQRFGSTTNASAQVEALSSYGLDVKFVQNANFALIESQIKKGIPVPCGYLHRGPVNSPTGGGHWLTVIGFDSNHVFVHDPLGEPDLITGETLNNNGFNLKFTKLNFGKRWMVKKTASGYTFAPDTGWAIIANR